MCSTSSWETWESKLHSGGPIIGSDDPRIQSIPKQVCLPHVKHWTVLYISRSDGYVYVRTH